MSPSLAFPRAVATKGHKVVVRLLLQADADPDPVDKDGETPLSMAKRNEHEKSAYMLSGG
jgi:ankyrin repeat protein